MDNTYYNNNNNNKQKKYQNHIAAATAATAAAPSSTIEKEIQQISLQRPLWYQKNGCNADKNPWNTCQQKKGAENFQKDGLHNTIQNEEGNHAFKSTQCKSR